MSSVLSPRYLPDGRVVFEEGSAKGPAEQLRDYDPTMSLVRNLKDDRWEVWRRCEDGEDRLMCHYNGSGRVPGQDLIEYLYTHDTRKGFDVVERAIAHNDKLEARRIAERHTQVEEELAPKTAAAVRADLGDPGTHFGMGRGDAHKRKRV